MSPTVYRSIATMVEATRLKSGYHSSTRRVSKLLAYLRRHDVPVDKLSLNDDTRPHAAHCDYVVVQEGTDADLTGGEFSAFRTATNKLLHGHRDTRFSPGDDTCLLVAYEQIDTMTDPQSPQAAGAELKDPSTVTKESDEQPADAERYDVRAGSMPGRDISYVLDNQTGTTYAVTLKEYEAEISPLNRQEATLSAEEKDAIVGAIIKAADGSQVPTTQNVFQLPGGYEQPTGGDGGAGGDEGSNPEPEDIEFVGDAGVHDYDAEQLVENVESWLSYKASDPTSDLIDGAWHTEFALMSDKNGNTEHGVYVRFDPWDGPLWDSSSNSFKSDDGKMPDEWKAHTAAMRSIFSAEDSPTSVVVDDDAGEYNEYYNYVPVDAAADMDM